MDYLQPIRNPMLNDANYADYEFRTFKGNREFIEQQSAIYAATVGVTYEVAQLSDNVWQLEVRIPLLKRPR